jgi:UDP-N-acetylmuramate: L-alanyl-gamma-D-glutamyl-meso-diaminopimelate ligase
MTGAHNVHNALATIAAVDHVGVDVATACAALNEFVGVRGRLEVRGMPGGITVYDDYAHHPTEIATTLDGLRRKVGQAKVIAVQEPRSNTMRSGQHREGLTTAFTQADEVCLYAAPDLKWNLDADVTQKIGPKAKTFGDIDQLVLHLQQRAKQGDHVVVMSNATFGGLIDKLLVALKG